VLAVPYALVCSVLAGAALLLAFPPYGQWWLAPIGVALLALACIGRRLRAGLGLGLITGIVFFGPLLAWTNMHVGYTPWILLTLFQASYVALLGAAIAWATPVMRRWLWSVPLVIGTLWVAQEALRDRAPFGGFPWGRLAFSQSDAPVLTFAALGGAPLVTFIVALGGGMLVAAAMAVPALLTAGAPLAEQARSAEAHSRGAQPRREGAAREHGDDAAADAEVSPSAAGPVAHGDDVAADAEVLPGGAGVEDGSAAGIRRAMAWTGGAVAVMAAGLLVPLSLPDGAPVTVAVVQGNVPRLGLEFNEQRKAVLDNHVQATIDLAERVEAGQEVQPDLVVWPENASDIDPLLNADAAAAIDSAVRAIDAPILVGAVLRGPGPNESRNAGIVWVPRQGAGQMYLKRHPVPFAEYLPLRPIVEPIAKAITNQAKLLRTDFVRGEVPGVLDLAGTQVGDVICFEVAYDEVVREVVESGAQLLAVQTNNATFDEAEAAQQLAMVRLRAVEHGRDSLMASTVGISAFVTADGEVHDATHFNTREVIVRELHIGESTTLATRAGAWPEYALALCAAGFLIVAAVRRRREAA
jgi:apolipoprotein N-acyltransferase